MSKRLITAAVLAGLALAGLSAGADNPDPRVQRQLRNLFGLVVESPRGDAQEGVVISEVLPNSPAERAGLREGDIITHVGRRSLEDFRDLANALPKLRQGERLNLRVERDGRFRTLAVMRRQENADEEDRDSPFRYGRANGDTNGDDSMFQRLQQRFRRLESRLQELERSGQYGQERGESGDMQRLQRRLDDLEERVQQTRRSGQYGRTSSSGVMLGARTREWRRQADSRQGGTVDEGVMVTAIDSDSPAAEAGLRKGDIITRVDDRDISSPQELRQALQQLEALQQFGRFGIDATYETTVEVLRGSRQMMLNVRFKGGSRYGAGDRRYERLQERIEQLESRVRELEQNP